MGDIMKMGKNPNYMGSWDLEDIPNRELTLTVREIRDEKVTGQEGRSETCTVVYWKEDVKPMILNITNKKTIVKLYKTRESEKLKGKQLTVTIKSIRAFGDVYEALRIKDVIPVRKAVPNEKCDECGGEIQPTPKMTSAQLAAYGRKKFGKALCANCAKKLAEAEAAKTEETADEAE